MIFQQTQLKGLDNYERRRLIQLSNRLEVLDAVAGKTDTLFAPGPKLLGGIFGSFSQMRLYKGLGGSGRFASYSSRLLNKARRDLTCVDNLELLERLLQEDLDHLECLYSVLINNCNPFVELGTRKGTTAYRATFIDDTYPKILQETQALGMEAKGKFDRLAAEIDKLHGAKGRTRTWEDPELIELQQRYDEYQGQLDDLRIMYRMVKKTWRNRGGKLRRQI